MTLSDVFPASAMKTDAALQKAKDYLALASHCESEAAKAQDKFLRYQLLSFAESYRMRSAKALEAVDMRRKAQVPHVISAPCRSNGASID